MPVILIKVPKMKCVKIISAIAYCIAFVISFRMERINLIITVLLYCFYIPGCSAITLAIHEIAHFSVFRLFGIRVSELRIGLIAFQFVDTHVSTKLYNTGFFYGHCIAVKSHNENPQKIVFSLSAGGISGFIIGVLSLIAYCLCWKDEMNTFLICLSTVALYSCYATLISKRSADYKEIRKALERAKLK